MIQVEEKKGLGDGQKIETEMARKVGLKIFRTYNNLTRFYSSDIKEISKTVEEWYEGGCANNDLENIFIGHESAGAYTERPKYETL